MATKSTNCPNCHGDFTFDSSLDVLVCPFCDSSFENPHKEKFEQVEVSSGKKTSFEKDLEKAEDLFTKYKDDVKAKKLFLDLKKQAPKDYRPHWGLIRVETKDFSLYELGEKRLDQLTKEVEQIFSMVKGTEQEGIKKTWSTYLSNVWKSQDLTHLGLDSKEKDLEESLVTRSQLQQNVSFLSNRITSLRTKIRNKEASLRKFQCILIIGLLVLVSLVVLYIGFKTQFLLYTLLTFLLIIGLIFLIFFFKKRKIIELKDELYQKEKENQELVNDLNRIHRQIDQLKDGIRSKKDQLR